jgi:hypothetical protein
MTKIMEDPEKDKVNKKIKGYWNYYQKFSRILSRVCRKMAFAEGGAFWILKTTTQGFPMIISVGLFMLVLYFICDALQYYVGMKGYDSLAAETKEKLKLNPKLKASLVNNNNVNKRIDLFINLKLTFIGISSILLLLGFANLFFCNP